MKFYLGTHETHWMPLQKFATVPLFISHRRLARNKGVPRAAGPWSLDSGGFTELSMYGRWETTQSEYVDAVYRYQTEIGGLEWASPQDWMCEAVMLEKTGKTLKEHQELTIQSVLSLREEAPDLPFIPVLQGNTPASYLDHVQQYFDAGVNLLAEPTVGVGSVCRRQATREIGALVKDLAFLGMNMHGFGVKLAGIEQYGHLLTSSDSMAWSYGARRRPPMAGHAHKSCANCPDFALDWRSRVLTRIQN